MIISTLLIGKLEDPSHEMTDMEGYRHFSAVFLSVGLACLASGFGIARFLRHGNNNMTEASQLLETSDASEVSQPLLVGRERRAVVHENVAYLTLSLCYMEAIGLYGLIVALFLVGSRWRNSTSSLRQFIRTDHQANQNH